MEVSNLSICDDGPNDEQYAATKAKALAILQKADFFLLIAVSGNEQHTVVTGTPDDVVLLGLESIAAVNSFLGQLKATKEAAGQPKH